METRDEELILRLREVLAQAPPGAAELEELARVDPADLAAAARQLEDGQTVLLLKSMPEDVSAEVLAHLDEDVREPVLELLTPREIADVVEEMDSDDAADVLAELEEDKAGEVVDLLGAEDREEMARLLAYPEDSAGGIMQLEVVAVRDHRNVARTEQKIRELYGEVKEDFYYVYVVDRDQRLVGRIPLPRLILAKPETSVRDIMEDTPWAQAEMDQQEVAQLFQKYDILSLPVVDREHHLIGRITVDDIVDVIQEEAEEDYASLAGTGDEEFLEPSVLRRAAIRLPWLVTGLAGGVLSALVLSRFEGNLREVIALAFFVPVITAMGGNVAIQSSAVMVRGLATGEIDARDAISRLAREVGVSVITGVVCAALIFTVAWLWSGDFRLGTVVGASMMCVVLISTSVGALVPLALDRAHIDPALATGPFVTTSNDILGILIYLSLATWLFSTT
ncbi:MAG: magnesium transporter [bacterium]